MLAEQQRTDQRFECYRRTGDRTLRNALVVDYGWLAHRCARRFVHRGEPFEDLVQVGQLGMLKAVERHDPSYGVPFSGFAIPTVLASSGVTSAITRG
jgi:RNA polymerase sigma-B factor